VADTSDMSAAPAAERVPDLARLKRYFTESEQLTQAARHNSLKAIDYYDSDQFTRAELAKLEERGQPAIVINRIKPAINGMIGVTEKGASNPRAWPRNPGDADSADAATDILRYICDFNRFKRLKQDCFKDLLVPGTMAALVGVDGDRQVTITQVRWEEFFFDARARRADFKDARYLGIAKWMYADDVGALYPDHDGLIRSSVDNSGGGVGVVPDESFQDRPLNGPGTGGAWIDPKQRRLLVCEVYYRDDGWKRAVFTGTGLLEYGPSPYLDHKGRPDCPIEAHSAYVRRDNGRYGAVWDMIGPQDEINKRRSKSVHLLSTTRIQVKDPSAIDVDADVARREAARPDGVIPYGWELAPNVAEFQGNIEMMAEAKAEIERMGPNPAVLGRTEQDASGRALLARQQSGLIELANLYGALEDWELRIYRQCWARAKQYWTAPQFIRVTDDEDSPKFVGLNQPRGAPAPVMGPDGRPATGPDGRPVMGEGPPLVHPPAYPDVISAADPEYGAYAGMPHPRAGEPNPRAGQAILGYRNLVAEMDVDIEVEAQTDIGNIASEQFSDILNLVKLSPVYQQQAPLSMLIQLSTIPHKRSILDQIKQAAAQQQAANAQQQALAMQHAQAQVAKTQSEAQATAAGGFAKSLDALTYAHTAHAETTAAGLEAGLSHEQQQQAFQNSQDAQMSDQQHQAAMAAAQQPSQPAQGQGAP
jgi:hypothetical protein